METLRERIEEMKQELKTYHSRWESRLLHDPCSKEVCSMIEEVAERVSTHRLQGHRV